jgi:predicted dehydrogenase
MAMDAASAGKDIYSEKCMARSIDEGKAIRKSIRDTGRIYQLGHQLRSRKSSFQAKEIIESGALGKVTYVTLNHSRNKPVGRKRGWFVPGPEDYPENLTPEHLDWERFLGSAPKRQWDPRRYLAWRCFWDYGTGLAGDMQSHVLDLTNQLLGMGIPEKAYSSGQITYWKDGREVPDIWHSVFEWPSRDLIIIYTCNFTNGRESSMCRFFGTEGTMEFYSDIKVYAEPLSHLYEDFFNKVKNGRIPRDRNQPGGVPPVHEYREVDSLAASDHMQDFFDCIRTRRKTRCNEDVAFQEIATTDMSVCSFRLNRAVGWDNLREGIVQG